ncbi:MAG: sulfite exporter TauE/SafE family protein [Lachnospiraceae bacterium]
MLINLLFFVICFGASIIGAICGIGGGVIIKPLLDTFGILDVDTISFLSGCTVLSMTTYSVYRIKKSGTTNIDNHVCIPLAVGAAVGGLIGKWMYSFIQSLSSDPNRIGAIQAACLTLVTVGTLLYTIYKDKINTYHLRNQFWCLIIGVLLGLMSAFLGIGGGPINLVVLFFFFSMRMKAAAETSLYLIFFSQLTSLIATVVTNTVPAFSIAMLVLMVIGGIMGGKCGRALNDNIEEDTVDKLFIGLMVVMIVINIYNIYQFM